MYNFAIESFEKTEFDRKANILLEYQYLLKNSGVCQRKTFMDCLRESTPFIPLSNRCALLEGVCNVHER